jgi:hypothetical protein
MGEKIQVEAGEFDVAKALNSVGGVGGAMLGILLLREREAKKSSDSALKDVKTPELPLHCLQSLCKLHLHFLQSVCKFHLHFLQPVCKLGILLQRNSCAEILHFHAASPDSGESEIERNTRCDGGSERSAGRHLTGRYVPSFAVQIHMQCEHPCALITQ